MTSSLQSHSIHANRSVVVSDSSRTKAEVAIREKCFDPSSIHHRCRLLRVVKSSRNLPINDLEWICALFIVTHALNYADNNERIAADCATNLCRWNDARFDGSARRSLKTLSPLMWIGTSREISRRLIVHSITVFCRLKTFQVVNSEHVAASAIKNASTQQKMP